MATDGGAPPSFRIGSVVSELETGIEKGWHGGAQLSYRLGAASVVAVAVGMSRDHEVMTVDTVMPWFCCSKPIVALVACSLAEQGVVCLREPVQRWAPRFNAAVPSEVTLEHLLTHTAGLPTDEPLRAAAGRWPDVVERAMAVRVTEPPGTVARYSTTIAWTIIAAALELASGRQLQDLVDEHVLTPMGLAAVTFMSPATPPPAGIAKVTFRRGPRVLPAADFAGAAGRWTIPGWGFRGPSAELARLYGALLDLLSSPTQLGRAARLMVETIRTDMFDPHYRADFPWGRGVARAPRLFGPHCSPRSFGHDGFGVALGFADPTHEVAAALTFTGGWDGPFGVARARRVIALLYEDLGLAGDDQSRRQ